MVFIAVQAPHVQRFQSLTNYTNKLHMLKLVTNSHWLTCIHSNTLTLSHKFYLTPKTWFLVHQNAERKVTNMSIICSCLGM